MANLADQLGWCITSKDHLKSLSDAINIAENNIANLVYALQSCNFSEYNSLIYPLQERFNQGSAETQKFIQESHLNYLDSQVQVIIQELDRFTS